MQIEGLIPFKSSTDQAITSLYFLGISNSLCSLCSVKSANMIASFDFSASIRHTSNVWPVPLELTPHSFFILLVLLIRATVGVMNQQNL